MLLILSLCYILIYIWFWLPFISRSNHFDCLFLYLAFCLKLAFNWRLDLTDKYQKVTSVSFKSNCGKGSLRAINLIHFSRSINTTRVIYLLQIMRARENYTPIIIHVSRGLLCKFLFCVTALCIVIVRKTLVLNFDEASICLDLLFQLMLHQFQYHLV